jgi:hypothetical protein
MKEKGIIFSALMIRAILEGRKVVTRRLSKRWLNLRPGDKLWGAGNVVRGSDTGIEVNRTRLCTLPRRSERYNH